MIPVAEAQALCLAGLAATTPETIPLAQAAGRALAAPLTATRAQPPFAASAMDGYAVQAADLAPGARFEVVGEAAAGHLWSGRIGPGQALRIFTGAPVPEGADRVVIQEDVIRDGETITIRDTLGDGPNIRPAGADFPAGFTLAPPHLIRPADLALIAAMNIAQVPVHRRPSVALIATGDELVMPGSDPRPDQIIASNVFALQAMVTQAGGLARVLPIAPDVPDLLRATFERALQADIVVTIGGASVGDHDLVAGTAQRLGFDMAFHKIAMRPGKPLMLGHRGATAFLGLPGNPVSAIVCGTLFLLPMLRCMQGLTDVLPQSQPRRLGRALPANGPRAHYMRAVAEGGDVTPFDRQDSALLSVLTRANALMIRPPHDPPRKIGDPMDTILISSAGTSGFC